MQNKIANQLPILVWKRSQCNTIATLIILLTLLSACASSGSGVSGGSTDGGSDESIASEREEDAPSAEDLDPDLLFHVLAAERFSADGNYQDAYGHAYEAAILSDNPDLARQAVGLAMRLDNWAGVTQSARRWRQLDASSDAAAQLVVLGLMNQNQVVAAARELAPQIESAEDRAVAWREAASLMASAESDENALATMEEVITRVDDADPSRLLESRSLLLWQLGEQDAALELALSAANEGGDLEQLVWAAQLAEAGEELETALGLYQRALEVEPDDAQLALAAAELMRELDRAPEAVSLLSSAPESTGTLYTLGLYQFESEDLDQAAQSWQRLADFPAPEDPDQHAYLTAFLAELLGQDGDALRWYRQVESGGNFDRARLRRAGLLARLDEMGQARELLARVRETGSEELIEQAWLAEAELLLDAGQPDDCVDLLTEILRQTPSSIWLLYSRALCAVDAERLELAEQDLRRIIQIDGDNAMALNALGYTLTDLTPRHSEALRLIQRALELQPDDAATLDSMGWVLYRLGRLDEALPYLQRAHAMDDNPEIAAHLAEVMFFGGQREEAMAMMDVLLDEHPNEAIVVETRQRLLQALE